MNKDNTFSQKLEHFLAGKGFYVVVLGCLCIVLVSAWAMFFEKKVAEEGVTVNTQPQTKIETPTVQEKSDTQSDKVTVTEKADTKKASAEKNEVVQASAPVEPTEELKNSPVFSLPLEGEIIASFSDTALVFSNTLGDWRTHLGTDISAEVGTEVYAVCDGEVKDVYKDDLLGTTVVIDHGAGIVSRYSNLDEDVSVSRGYILRRGAAIGKVGKTAICEHKDVSHLHFAMTLDGKYVDPISYMPQ